MILLLPASLTDFSEGFCNFIDRGRDFEIEDAYIVEV